MTRADRQLALWLVRGHDERLANYNAERESIMLSCGGDPFSGIGGASGKISDTTFDKAMRLAKLAATREHRYIQAYDASVELIGIDYRPALRERLRHAIIANCVNRQKCPFRKLAIDFISEREFYRKKDEFLENILKRI